MNAKEWLVPLLAASLTFGGLWALTVTDPPQTEARSPYLFVSPDGAIVVTPPARVLVLDRDHVHDLGPDIVLVHDAGFEIRWVSPHVAFAATVDLPKGCDCFGPLWHLRVLPDRHATFGVDGYNATRVTVHAFDSDGNLVLSNGDPAEVDRLTHGLSPDALPTGTWYLGANATAPAGTQHPPAYAGFLVDQVRPSITGQPEGFVTSFHTDALATFYGRLYVTLRIDDLVHAP